MEKKYWLVGGFVAAAIPLLLIFDDSFHDGFGPFYLVGFLMVLMPVFFVIGAVIGLFFDKYVNPATGRVFYWFTFIPTGIISLFWVLGLLIDASEQSGVVMALKAIFLNAYNLPLVITLVIAGLSVKRLREFKHKE